MAEVPQIDLPFRWEWRGPDIGPARPHDPDMLYGNFPLESLPPLPPLDGTLSWLASVDPVDSVDPANGIRTSLDTYDATLRDDLARIEQEAAALGLTLPQAFKRLMSSSALLDRFPVYAGSWFPPLEHLTACIFGGRGRLLCFLRDQQNSVVWYLYLTPEGDAFVVSCFAADIDTAKWDKFNYGRPPNEEQRAEALAYASVCATSFEDFLYRLFLEFHIAHKVDGFDETPLTDAERRYLASYEAS